MGGTGSDTIYGDAGSDSIDGGTGADSLYGNEGADTIDGGDGNDLIQGGRGPATLSGGLGDDVIYGWNKSIMSGGAATDTFCLAGSDGFALSVSITDYEVRQTVDLSDFGFTPDQVHYTAAKHVLTGVSDQAHIVMHDVSGHFGDELISAHIADGTLVI